MLFSPEFVQLFPSPFAAVVSLLRLSLMRPASVVMRELCCAVRLLRKGFVEVVVMRQFIFVIFHDEG